MSSTRYPIRQRAGMTRFTKAAGLAGILVTMLDLPSPDADGAWPTKETIHEQHQISDQAEGWHDTLHKGGRPGRHPGHDARSPLTRRRRRLADKGDDP